MNYSIEELKQAGIYSITNKLNGKVYIGSAAKSFIKRWWKHKYDLKNDNHHSQHLQNAWNKCIKDGLNPEEIFEFKILETIREELLFEWLLKREQWWMDLLGSTDPNYGYNICPIAGSPLGIKRSEESKEKMAAAKRKYPVGTKRVRKKAAEDNQKIQTTLNTRNKIEKAVATLRSENRKVTLRAVAILIKMSSGTVNKHKDLLRCGKA